MENVYENIYEEFKKYIIENSQYEPKIAKYNTNASPYFPLVTCVLSNNTDTDYRTIENLEYYEAFYFTIDIYAKDKVKGTNVVVASQVIIDELSKLTMEFFGNKLGMRKTLNKITPNLDKSILRKTLNYQGMIGNVRLNIIRR